MMSVVPQRYFASTQPARVDLNDVSVCVDRLEGDGLFCHFEGLSGGDSDDEGTSSICPMGWPRARKSEGANGLIG